MNDKLWVLVLIAGNIFCVRSKNPQQPSMLHNGNPANSDDKYVVYTERLRRAIREFGLTDAKLNLRRESRDDVSLENCGLATTDKCNGVLPPDGSRPSRLFEQVKRIESAIDCQWFCADYYSQNCTWFLYDETSKYCKLFTGPREELYDDCYELGFSSTPSLSECISTVSSSDANSCYWFRQGYCRFDNDLLDNLEHSKNMTTCQQACQFNPSCNFFHFLQR